jgi:dihydrofolate reductase
MTKLRVFESVSIDGYFTDKDNKIDWAHAGQGDDPEFTEWVSANASKGGALLFGRKTYQEMAAFWPTPEAAHQMPVVANGMNTARKYVVTNTIKPTWQNSQRLDGDLGAAVQQLKAASGTDITLLGSGDIATQLGELGLVDEYQFVIIPIALGSGRTLFSNTCNLRLLDQRAFPCGNVVVTYVTR